MCVITDMNEQRFKTMARKTTPKTRALSAVFFSKQLPFDIFSRILEYAYMSSQIHQIYYINSLIHKQIENAPFCTRLYDNCTEQWLFWTGNRVDPQFQSINCINCGNYKVPYPYYAPSNIICHGH